MTDTDEIRAQLAPTGRLRVALNHGNRVLVSRTEDGSAQGITPISRPFWPSNWGSRWSSSISSAPGT